MNRGRNGRRNRIFEEKSVRSTQQIVDGNRTRLGNGPLVPRFDESCSTPECRRQSITSSEHLLSPDREEDREPRNEILRVRIGQSGDLLVADQDGGEISGESVASGSGVDGERNVAEEVQVGSGVTAVTAFHSDGWASREIMLEVKERFGFRQERAVGQLSHVTAFEGVVGVRVVRIHGHADSTREQRRRNRSDIGAVLLRNDDGVG